MLALVFPYILLGARGRFVPGAEVNQGNLNVCYLEAATTPSTHLKSII